MSKKTTLTSEKKRKMGAATSSNSNKKWLPLILLLVVVAQICIHHANAIRSVEFLPGFQGPLPFQLETGYVGVGDGDGDEEGQVFYYFVKSESNQKEDPLMIWMTGGPGCSSLTGLLFEIGPIMFKMVEYNGTLPTLLYNPNSWTNMASIIFVDLPLGTGFTYTKTPRPFHSEDQRFANHTYEFITKWLSNHPEFISNPFYLGGDSYSGIPIPIVAQHISNGNEVGIDQFINLKGYILGNPLTFPSEGNYCIQFAHGMGLIPDELYESLKKSCGEEYRERYVDPNNIHCLQHLKAYDECLIGLHTDHILEPECGSVFLMRPTKSLVKRRSALDERINEPYLSEQSFSPFRCRDLEYSLAYYWANDKSVRDALHIQKATVGEWKRCSGPIILAPTSDVRPYHLNLSSKGYRTLIYSGDHDMIVPYQATQAWIKDLNYSIVDPWRPWRVNGQIAGYTRTFSNNMTFATVKGGGHTAPEYKPKECFEMFKQWISHEPV